MGHSVKDEGPCIALGVVLWGTWANWRLSRVGHQSPEQCWRQRWWPPDLDWLKPFSLESRTSHWFVESFVKQIRVFVITLNEPINQPKKYFLITYNTQAREHKSREGNGNPLQYSCLENPMDRGAWWATVHGVTKSRTRLSNPAHTQSTNGCHRLTWKNMESEFGCCWKD